MIIPKSVILTSQNRRVSPRSALSSERYNAFISETGTDLKNLKTELNRILETITTGVDEDKAWNNSLNPDDDNHGLDAISVYWDSNADPKESIKTHIEAIQTSLEASIVNTSQADDISFSPPAGWALYTNVQTALSKAITEIDNISVETIEVARAALSVDDQGGGGSLDYNSTSGVLTYIGDENAGSVFTKSDVPIKNLPSLQDIGSSANLSIRDWLIEMFFPFLASSYSSVSGSTLAELGTTTTSYTLGSSFTIDAGDNVTAATASYRLTSGSWSSAANILSSVDDSGSGDPLTFSHSHAFTSISLAEDSEFAFTFTFDNNGTARVLDGKLGTGPKRSLSFEAKSIQGQFSSEFPTATQLLAKVKSLSSSALTSFNITAPSTEYGYYAIPVRFGKYVYNLEQGGRVLAGWEIVTNLTTGTTTPTVDSNDNTLVVNSSKYHSLPLSADTNQSIDYIIYKTIDPLNTGATLGYTVTLTNL